MRRDRILPLLASLLAAFFFLPLARAHDPYESWSNALVKTDTLELTVTLAQTTALRLIDPQATIRGLTLENFPQYRARLEKEAVALYVLTSLRKPLVPRKAVAELTEENDVVFRVTYPRPAPGRLHFHAAFLKKLGDGYGGILEVADTSGNHLGWEQLLSESLNYEVTVLPPSAPKKS